MKTPLIIALSSLLLVGGSAARQTETKGREASVVAVAARQAQELRLKAQLAAWQKIRAEDWTEAQQKKKQYDQYARQHPDYPVDRSLAEAQQASGRVEMVDRILKDIEQRLTRLGPAPARQSDLTPHETAVATLAEKEIEGALLSAQRAAWQSIRADEWEVELRLKREYEEYARQHPDYPVDRSGAEAGLAIGRVEALDRFLAATTRRLAALESEIKVARAELTVPAGLGGPCFARIRWTASGQGQVSKSGTPSANAEITESGGLGPDVQVPLQMQGNRFSGTLEVREKDITRQISFSGEIDRDLTAIRNLKISSRMTHIFSERTGNYDFRDEWEFALPKLSASRTMTKADLAIKSLAYYLRFEEAKDVKGFRYHYKGQSVEKTLTSLESLSLKVNLDPELLPKSK
jgi:hypothetical protein